jgi:hypothetical protein
VFWAPPPSGLGAAPETMAARRSRESGRDGARRSAGETLRQGEGEESRRQVRQQPKGGEVGRWWRKMEGETEIDERAARPGTGRDGNGYPLLETQWVFALLGYEFGSISLLMGLLMGSNGKPTGTWSWVCSSTTHTRKLMSFLNPP